MSSALQEVKKAKSDNGLKQWDKHVSRCNVFRWKNSPSAMEIAGGGGGVGGRVSTVSEEIKKFPASVTSNSVNHFRGRDLNVHTLEVSSSASPSTTSIHNHVKPETVDVAVMAKATTSGTGKKNIRYTATFLAHYLFWIFYVS